MTKHSTSSLKTVLLCLFMAISQFYTSYAQAKVNKSETTIKRDKVYKGDLLETETTWGQEIFTFPIKFAKNIDFKGIEDARFPQGWLKTDSSEFWSYTFAWNINLNEELTAQQLEEYMRKYYDGLSADVNKEQDRLLDKTVANFHKNSDGSFTGQAIIHDSFVTKKSLTLNFKITQKRCVDKQRSIVKFLISPADYNNEIWSTLDKIQLRKTLCD